MNATMDWDLSAFFPGVESDAYRDHVRRLTQDVDNALERFGALAPLDAGNGDGWEAAIGEYEDLATHYGHARTYVGCLRAFDVGNEAARRAEGELSRLGASIRKLGIELVRGVRDVQDEDFAAFCARPALADASHFLRLLRREAAQSMSPELEGLAAELATDGLHAWGRLYDDIAGSLTFELDGEQVPMAQRRSLMRDPDRDLRRRAFENGNRAWENVREPLAHALNHIAGTRLTLYRRRGIRHFLEAACEDGGISVATLDAMFSAVEQHADLPRRFLALKARTMGTERVSWYDLEAPIPLPGNERIPFEEGRRLIGEAFRAQYASLADYFEAALQSRWVEHNPRPGKQSGAFCASSSLIDESRVFMTYQGALGDVSTLAHEIGHGFHAHVMRGMRPLARRYPMTLAESASTFAELVLSESLLKRDEIDDTQRASLLAAALSDAVTFLLDITTRFRFEEAFYTRRQEGELSASELDGLMSETQQRIFGEVLDEDDTDPLYWASKLHFFITPISFYNFPYTFGYLLSRGLRAMHAAEGPAFLPKYEAFLRQTGSGFAHEVAQKTLGRDLESTAFWSDAIVSLEPQLNELERLLPKILPED
jgi:oligoendopeptidase F